MYKIHINVIYSLFCYILFLAFNSITYKYIISYIIYYIYYMIKYIKSLKLNKLKIIYNILYYILFLKIHYIL